MTKEDFAVAAVKYCCLAVLLGTVAMATARADQTVVLRSGNGPIGSQDSLIHVLPFGTTGNITPTPANFSSAQNAPLAFIVPADPAYIHSLPSDPSAQWIAVNSRLSPGSALFAVPFQVTDATINSASLDFHFAVDNAVNGVFFNGVRISGNSSDGDYHAEYRFVRSDIAPLLVPNATNWLYVEMADDGVIAALIFNATLTMTGGSNEISPSHGGNTGNVTVTIAGQNFQDAALNVVLRGSGPDVVGITPQVLGDTTVVTTFNLLGVTPGARDVVVTQGGVTVAVFPDSFTVEDGGTDHLSVDIIGPSRIRAGREGTFEVIVTNDGNIDAPFVTLQASSNSISPQRLSVRNAVTKAQLGSCGFSLQNIYVPIGSLTFPFSCGTSGATCIGLNASANKNAPDDDCTDEEAAVASAQARVRFLETEVQILTNQLAVLQQTYASTCNPVTASNAVQCALLQNEISQKTNELAIAQADLQQAKFDLLYAEAELDACLTRLRNKGSSVFSGTTTVADTSATASASATSANSSLGFCGVTSLDPNDKVGVAGIGQANYVRPALPLSYTIFFENQPTASASAAEVVISDQLSAALDPSSILIRDVRFGSTDIPLAQDVHSLNTSVDLRSTLNLFVDVSAQVSGNTLSVKFASIDPNTGAPPTDLRGFLPPNTNPPAGEGSVTFTIMPRPGLTTDTQITNQAGIVFDTNAPILTPVWLNTIDNTKPVSSVSGLASTQSSATFIVRWSGDDVGAGIQSYTIYMSDNGGPFAPVFENKSATQANFTGVPGHTYSFYSIARDQVGNEEGAKTIAEATTRVAVDTTPPVVVPTIAGTLGSNGWYTSNVTVTWTVSDPESGVTSSSGCSPTTLTTDTSGTTLTCSATNGVGLSASASATVKIDKTPPVISGMPSAGCSIWPPNKKMVQVATINAGDALSGIATGSLRVSASSNEPSNPANPDVAVIPNGSGGFIVQLRADRLGAGTGRTYTVNASAADLAGNTVNATSTCTVPHDQGQ
jgi:hypothetical protein